MIRKSDERTERMQKRYMACAVGVLLSLVGCATPPRPPRPPRVTYSPDHHLLTVGYDADRLDSIFRAQHEAQRYCWEFENHQKMLTLNQSTIYQGRFDEQLTEAAKVAGRAGSVLGQPDVDKARQIMSSGTDYKTTVEFQCQ